LSAYFQYLTVPYIKTRPNTNSGRTARFTEAIQPETDPAPQNFWPLREFTDLHDINRQVRQWLAEVANQRLHRETRERPLERFKSEALGPLPIIPHDYRDSTEALVHKDLRLAFDGNRYCVHQRYVGRRLTVKADSGSVVIYDRVEEVVSYPRSWRRGQTFGADRFFEYNNWYLASATDALYNAGGTLVVRNTAGTSGNACRSGG
jgi:hypothetical protein